MRKKAVMRKAKYRQSRITSNVPVILLCLCIMHLTFCVLPAVLFVKLTSMPYFVAFFFSFSCTSTFLKLKKEETDQKVNLKSKRHPHFSALVARGLKQISPQVLNSNFTVHRRTKTETAEIGMFSQGSESTSRIRCSVYFMPSLRHNHSV